MFRNLSNLGHGRLSIVFSILISAGAVCGRAAAEDAPCPLPGQTQALVVKMFFGQSVKDRGHVTQREWRDFLRQTVTPRFPDGFTVYDAYGQWRDRDTQRVARENSKVIEVATENTEAVRNNIAAISDAYRKRFRQQAVAVLSNMACVAFS